MRLVWRVLARILKIDVRHALVNSVGASGFVSTKLRCRILRLYGVSIGEDVEIYPGCRFGGQDITIGPGTFLNTGVVLDNSAAIELGANVTIAHDVLLITSGHEYGPSHHRATGLTANPIVIGEGCWLGARVIVLPGVTIGPGCVVGAGSVVSTDLAADGLYLGTPAKRIRDLG